MTNSDWQTCEHPDLMLEVIMPGVNRQALVDFVRQCWRRVEPFLPPLPHDYTVVEQFAAIVDEMSDHDAVVYASEAALKAAGLAPNMKEEQKAQAELLRRIFARVQLCK